MSTLEEKLAQIASSKTHNLPLVQAYLKDPNARTVGQLLARLSSRTGIPAKRPPSSSLSMLD